MPLESVAKTVSCSCCILIFFQPVDCKYMCGDKTIQITFLQEDLVRMCVSD